MKNFKNWIRENYPEDDPSHIFSDPNDWTQAAKRNNYSQDYLICFGYLRSTGNL